MNDDGLQSVKEINAFLATTQRVNFSINKVERYAWIARTLKRVNYFELTKKEKTIVRIYLFTVTHYSRQQLSRLICQYKNKKWIGRRPSQRTNFFRRYTKEDILLLVKTDKYHQTLSGAATKKLFERAYYIFSDTNYERLAFISISHIYNLRKSKFYLRQGYHFQKTKLSAAKIGERRKPAPNNQPGYIRIDTVHQGDKAGEKGVYHINAVDEVTQFEMVCSVEKISEQYLIPILSYLIEAFPFEILGFHSDNGSEYINYTVASLLSKLHIEFTKSRARRSNDNALVESKNGAIVRKVLGYIHIPQKHADRVNTFNQRYLVPYLNYHRPCFFSRTTIDKKGKLKKNYHYKDMMTPYEKLRSLPNSEQYLKQGLSFELLDKEANKITDLESAKRLLTARGKLFTRIFSIENIKTVDNSAKRVDKEIWWTN